MTETIDMQENCLPSRLLDIDTENVMQIDNQVT